MTKTEELFKRWDGLLRRKASEYEHPVRMVGGRVTEPSIDDICNEMDAFLAGITQEK